MSNVRITNWQISDRIKSMCLWSTVMFVTCTDWCLCFSLALMLRLIGRKGIHTYDVAYHPLRSTASSQHCNTACFSNCLHLTKKDLNEYKAPRNLKIGTWHRFVALRDFPTCNIFWFGLLIGWMIEICTTRRVSM